MLVGGDATPEMRKRGNDTNWFDANLTGPKNEKKNHAVDSANTNK
jgi:hypothetical protein